MKRNYMFKWEDLNTDKLTVIHTRVLSIFLSKFVSLHIQVDFDGIKDHLRIELDQNAKESITALLTVFQLESFSAIKRKQCRVALRGGKVYAIGHPQINNWLCIEKMTDVLITGERQLQLIWDITSRGMFVTGVKDFEVIVGRFDNGIVWSETLSWEEVEKWRKLYFGEWEMPLKDVLDKY